MNAFEFVKEKGIDGAKAFLDLPEYTIDQLMMLQAGLRCVDLKRIVDSHGIVEGDFESVELAEYEYAVSDSYDDPYWIRVKQAISDVEVCQ